MACVIILFNITLSTFNITSITNIILFMFGYILFSFLKLLRARVQLTSINFNRKRTWILNNAANHCRAHYHRLRYAFQRHNIYMSVTDNIMLIYCVLILLQFILVPNPKLNLVHGQLKSNFTVSKIPKKWPSNIAEFFFTL